ncbi:MAG: hypothetical protein J5I52_02935 [Saprospiraceae bacterium]|nr:MAG: hypothetical protein UZ09_BCD002000894 [Bacteroidetes bacterium OLB9]MCO6463086.1 hypothetical protein [Saprospiraceae bacterium]MCZ2337716.1 hypothetical protein [Chitinophagales bacterium]
MKLHLLTCIILGLFLGACKSNTDERAQNIIGTWDVYQSNMNSKPNGFMKDAYFDFKADSTVESNVFEDNNPHTYQLEGNRLIIDAKIPFDLNIGRLDRDSMYLEGKMSYYYMEYFLVKRK